jgi:hypothetical protein
MDRTAFGSLAQGEKAKALLAYDTAQKLCSYFQACARKGSQKDIPRPAFTQEEKQVCHQIRAMTASFFAAEEKSLLKKTARSLYAAAFYRAAGESGKECGPLAYKLTMATQMNFYRDNPGMMAVFGIKNREDGREILQKLERFQNRLPETIPAVDALYRDAYEDFRRWAPLAVSRLPSKAP